MMKQPKTNYFYRIILCLLFFTIGLLSSHQQIDHSIDQIIAYSDQVNEEIHIFLLFLVPIYLAIVIFGFGLLSVFISTKIEQFFDQ